MRLNVSKIYICAVSLLSKINAYQIAKIHVKQDIR